MADFALKHITPRKLLWLDLEMTGLNPARDRILEAAVIITDWDFNELARFESGVGQDRAIIQPLLDANELYTSLPHNKTAMLDLAAKSPAEHEVEAQLLALANTHFASDEPALLAGNSIHTDRAFIKQWWPRLEQRLHYRMLDVTAFKVVMIAKYGVEYSKAQTHRALDDIAQSIAELQFYLANIRR